MTDTLSGGQGIVERVQFDGLTQASQQLAQMAGAATQAKTAVEGLTAAQAPGNAADAGRVESASQVTQALQAQTQAMQAQSAASDAAQQSTGGFALEQIRLSHHLAGAANAVQELTTMFGGESEAAGLVGHVIGASTHFAQLGQALGPEGALIGGILGAAIPAITALIEHMDSIGHGAEIVSRSADQVVASYQHWRDAQELTERLANGTATLDERMTRLTQAEAALYEARRQQASISDQLARAQGEEADATQRGVAGLTNLFTGRRDDITAMERQTIAMRERIATLVQETAAARTATQVMQAMTAEEIAAAQAHDQSERDANEGAEKRARDARRAERRQAHIHAAEAQLQDDEEAAARIEAMWTAAETAAREHDLQVQRTEAERAARRTTLAARPSGVNLDAEEQRVAQLRQQVEDLHTLGANDTQQHSAAAALHAELDIQRELVQSARELERARNEAADAAVEGGERYEQAMDRLNAAEQRSQDLEERGATERHRHSIEAQRDLTAQQHAEQSAAQERQRSTQVASQLTGSVIGGLTNVFTLMTKQHLEAGTAAEMMLGSTLSAIAQIAEVKALESVASALLAASTEDWGGFAMGIAAAAAWAAVAVATGVGGAAVTNDAQSKAQAQQGASPSGGGGAPASPTSGGTGSSQHQPANVTVVWNAPVMTAQTQSQLMRTLRRGINLSQERYATP